MVHLYGLILGIATVVWLSVAEMLDKRATKMFPWILLGAMLGARIYHVSDYWEYYQQNPGQILAVWRGGLGIWGGLLGGLGSIWIYQKLHKLEDIWKLGGAIVTPLPLAQAIGRVGNYVNGEFLNRVGAVPWWGLEAGLNLGLFGWLWWLGRTKKSLVKAPQRVVAGYLMGYGMIRFGLEFWRVESWKWGHLGVAQWISLVSIVIGWSLWQWQNVQE